MNRACYELFVQRYSRDLVASELFGHEKGAFTGAARQRLGRFELAIGGTIFLDEVGELPIETQIALLRVLQERKSERIGGIRRIHADVRIIAATNRYFPQNSMPIEPKDDSQLSAWLQAQEKRVIEAALRESRGRVYGPSGAAAKLGIARSTLESKIWSLKIDKNRFKSSTVE